MSIQTKKDAVKNKIKEKHGCVGICDKCTKIHAMIDKMEASNIPASYWFVNKDKLSDGKIKEILLDYIADIKQSYLYGKSIYFCGNQGIGKTYASICILKESIKNNFSAYYITASDMFSEMLSKETNSVKNILKNSDFLVIDEVDSRFFSSDSVKEIFSGIFENIFRFRTHNSLPTILCSNETNNILSPFFGQSVQSISSLFSQYMNIFPVAGKDFRKK